LGLRWTTRVAQARPGSDFQRRRGTEIVPGVDKGPLEAEFRFVEDIERIELLPERIVE
jgi:hypothetical protein